MGRMFQSFSQADAATSRKYGGTGLGLAISKRLAEADGRHDVGRECRHSGAGQHVPSHHRHPRGCRPDSPPTASGPGPGKLDLDPEHAANHPLRILLVEDNVVNQKLATRLLGRMGYDADLAGNGIEAIDAVEPSALRPGADGRSDAGDGWPGGDSHIVEQVPLPDRPWIVAMTANAMDGDRERCIEAGMNGYISKPIRVEELVAALLGTPPMRE